MRAFVRFLVVGSFGFVIDAGLTYLLIRTTVQPWLARIPAIVLAMAFTWLANRGFTYQVTKKRTVDEAVRYAIVAIAMAVGNYLIYLILMRVNLGPVVAVATATVCQTMISFHAYRRFVFREQ
jgi:putative flippase GtrA